MSAFITINGGIGRDPRVREVGRSSKVADFSLASSSYDGKSKGYTVKWFQIEVWGQQADFVMTKLAKGSKVLVFGEYIQNEYTDKNNNKVEASYVKATKVELLADPKNQQQQKKQAQPHPVHDASDIPF